MQLNGQATGGTGGRVCRVNEADCEVPLDRDSGQLKGKHKDDRR